MEQQRVSGDFGRPIRADSQSEAGHIAVQYNRVIEHVNDREQQLREINSELKSTTEELTRSSLELDTRLEELERFNDLAVGRELKMVELKQEINELCQSIGQPERYDLSFTEEEPPD
ncbi:MAG: hypothetical protein V3T14_12005 [Myxococcota bacterium]